MDYLKVQKVIVRDANGKVKYRENSPEPLYNYDVIGALGIISGRVRVQRAHLDVTEKQVESGSKGVRGYAYAMLDELFSDDDNSAVDCHLERIEGSFTNSAGDKVATVSYEVVAQDDIGFEMRFPMKPRVGTDRIILDNMIRFQEFLKSNPEQQDKVVKALAAYMAKPE